MVRFTSGLELGLGERESLAFQLEGRQKGALKGKSRLQGELGRAAWSEA